MRLARIEEQASRARNTSRGALTRAKRRAYARLSFPKGGRAMRITLIAAGLLVSGAALAQQQTCFPSKFGPNDQVGNLNHVTPEKTLAATRLVTKGKAYRQIGRASCRERV